MMGFSLPDLLRVEAVCASLVLVLCLWPMARAFSTITRDLRKSGTTAIVAMLAIWLVAVFLRQILANPTFLGNLPDLHIYFERLFSPLGNASTWHHHHGMGGFVMHAGLAQLFGKSYELVWAVNGLVGSLAPLLLYAVTLKLTGDRRAAFLAAVLLAVYPPAVRVDASEQIHSLSVVLILLTYSSVMEALEKPSLRTWLAAGIAGAAALQMRAEAIPHVFFACTLALLRIRGLARPRWNWALVLGMTVLAVPAIPRALVTLLDIANEGLSTWGAGFGVSASLFLSGRHVYLNPLFSLPIYPALTLAGIVMLARARYWRLLVFLVIVLALQYFAYLNEWTLDINEAFRFQAHTWFFQIMLAGMGLAWLSRLVRNRRMQGLVVGIGIAAAAYSWIPARQVMLLPQAADQDVLFFAEQIPRVPHSCRLVMLRVSHPESKRYFGPGTWPEWLLEEQGRKDTLSYPEDLDQVAATDTCFVVHIGIDCYRRYPGDSMDEAQLEEKFHQSNGPYLYETIDSWRSELDRHPPPLLRPECQEVWKRFELEKSAEMVIPPGRPTWIWRPDQPVTIGLYRKN